ncbi:hypothetical protein [Flavisphingomonas formosensis]|uniref:hypothetical protein n=1 Tax=Flavisphingomonas formosensis TaxID=861534 RepID=UPI0012FC3AEA|nr:hypothetical protein [Sphingomonas formosensis]
MKAQLWSRASLPGRWFVLAAITAFIVMVTAPVGQAKAAPGATERALSPEAIWIAQFGDWTVFVTPEFTQASTSGAKGTAFGFVCGEDCVNFLDLRMRCEAGKDYSGTALVDARRFTITASCYEVEGISVLALNFNVPLLLEMKRAAKVHFEVAFGRRRVGMADFSLKGCREALIAAASTLPSERT